MTKPHNIIDIYTKMMHSYDGALLTSFGIPLDDDIQFFDALLKNFVINAQSQVVVGDTTYFHYYPSGLQSKGSLQIVVEGDTKSQTIRDFFVHHNGWLPLQKFQITEESNLIDCKNIYTITNDEDSLAFVRLINRRTIDPPQPGDTIAVQAVLMAAEVLIYDNFQAYEDTLKHKHIGFAENRLFPLDYINNNKADLSEEERSHKPHSLDCTLRFCATIIDVRLYAWSLFDSDKLKMPNYIRTKIQTQFGELYVYFSANGIIENYCQNPKVIQKGNLLVGRAILSGDVCVGKNDHYQDTEKPHHNN